MGRAKQLTSSLVIAILVSLGRAVLAQGEPAQVVVKAPAQSQGANPQIDLRLTLDHGRVQVTAVEARVKEEGVDWKNDQTTPQRGRKPATSARAKSLAIVSPAGRENWEIGQIATIHWRPSEIGGNVTVELFRHGKRIALISQAVAADARVHRWRLSGKEIVPGGGYQVRMTTLADRKSYLSEAFSISEEYQPSTIARYALARRPFETRQEATLKLISVKVLAPKRQDQWNVLQEYPIRWESEGLSREDEIVIALKPISGKMAKIIAIAKNTGEFAFRVPYPAIFMGDDIQAILAPLRARSQEVLSEPFAILRPMVDLIANNPSISYSLPEKRKRKWWEVLGDVFTGGILWHVREVIEVTTLKAEGTTMEVDVNVINKGLLTRKGVTVDCSIQTLWGNVLYSFARQVIPAVYPDLAAPVRFSARTKAMNLEQGNYVLEVLIDPEGKAGELEPFRGNNRVTVEFEVK